MRLLIEVLSPNDLVVGGRLKLSSLTHFNEGSQHIFSVRNKKILFLAHLSLLRVSFWDTAMSVVRRKCGRPRHTRRLSVNFLACVHSRGNSFDPKFMKLCQNVTVFTLYIRTD